MIQVSWSAEDAEFVAIEPERYPSLAVLSADKDEAREELRLLIESIEAGEA